MKYYSTNHTAPTASLRDAVIGGLAPDKGLYMPERIKLLPATFYRSIEQLTFQEISFEVAKAFFGEDVPEKDLKDIVDDTLSFDTPLVKVKDNIYSLELFHGPTLAFKDVGARFMARLLRYLVSREQDGATGSASSETHPTNGVNVLVATSGDTGSAVANGFLGVEGIHVYVLYPKGKVSPLQECQFTTLGQNITAVEVDGVFDDCQALVKQAFMDDDLKAHALYTSANSINVARFLPQAFYYFNAYAHAKRQHLTDNGRELTVCVPSGNFGNLTAGLFARRMGLPVRHFIAANNANDVFYQYLISGEYHPMASIQTLANAMDVGAPSNFARILDLYGHSVEAVRKDISGATYKDDRIRASMQQCYNETGYILDPHGACGYQALVEQLPEQETGIFLETAHPAKFKDRVDGILGIDLPIPERLQAFASGKKVSTPLSKKFDEFKQFLLAE